MLTENYAILSDTLSPIITRRLRNERLDIMGGGSIDFWSMDQPDRIRGHRYAPFIVNEAAIVPGLMDAWNMIIRPTLMDLGGSIDFMSTPRGLNDFFNLWQMAFEMKGWERFHYTSYDNSEGGQQIRQTVPAEGWVEGERECGQQQLPERDFAFPQLICQPAPGTASQRIAERLGFRLAYIKALMVKLALS